MKLSKKFLSGCKKHVAKKSDPVVRNAVHKMGIKDATMNKDALVAMQHTFSHHITTGKITEQKRSGRCWIFAGLNMLRDKVAKKYKIKDFELSQNYLHFYDKLEKANYFLESIIATKNEESDSRLVQWLLMTLVEDGGQWDMFANLVNKYGVVPKHVMPESFHSSNTAAMNQLLRSKLRASAIQLRKAKNPKAKKEKFMQEIYFMLVHFLGEPPAKFDFEWRDDANKFHSDRGLTPHTFLSKYVKVNMDDYISVVNAPARGKPLNKMLTVQNLGNVIEGHPVRYLNVSNAALKKLTVAQLKNNEPVWFGCDVGKYMDLRTGVLDTNLFLFESALKTKIPITKGERIEFLDSQLTHAMLFTGVNLVKGKPNRWRVENSWGEKSILGDKVGDRGFFVMSDEWFDTYNYQVIIHKKYLTPQMKKVLHEDPIELPPWDPLGSLALMR